MDDDRRLAMRAAAGDDAAFGALVERHRAALVRTATRGLGGYAADAEDVVQDALSRAHATLRRGVVPDNLAAWLHTIVRNRAVDVVRSHPGRRGVPLEDHDGPAGDTPDAAFARRESVDAALSAIDGLPGRQRSALLGSVFAGTSYEDLAAEQGTTVSAMKTLLVRARRTVRAAAAAILPFPGAVRARLWLLGGHLSDAANGVTGTVVKSCAVVAAVGATTFVVPPPSRSRPIPPSPRWSAACPHT